MSTLTGRKITIADLGRRYATKPTPAAAPAGGPPKPPSKRKSAVGSLKYPVLFDKQKPKPLAIGAYELIIADLGCDPRVLAFTLKYWCSRAQYRSALIAAEHRYGLDGTPSGEVTEEHRLHAREGMGLDNKTVTGEANSLE